MQYSQRKYATITIHLKQIDEIEAYLPFLVHFSIMLGTIFEERRQRLLNQDLLREQKNRVAARTDALNVAKDRAELYLENIEVILLVLDSNANIQLINRKGCQILGHEQKELIGRNWFDLCLPHGEANNVNAFFRRIVSGEDSQLEYHENQILTRTGRKLMIAWHNSRLIDSTGVCVGTLSSGEDITQIREMEKARESLIHELELKNNELERFGYNISHDLRSPLVTIQGFIGESIIAIQEGDIAEALSNLHGVPGFSESMVTLDVDNENVIGDQSRLTSVWQNLIENAIKYQQSQETLQISIKSATDMNNHIFIVADNGIGIEPKFHDHVFRLFDKIDQSSQGTGVGQAIVKRIIEAHQGKVTLESELGVGSQFKIMFPRNLDLTPR